MKQFAKWGIALMMLGTSALTLTSCGDSTESSGTTPTPTPTNPTSQTITGSITANQTWTKNTRYILTGFVYVKSGATLTIEPGTIIRGDKATKGSLIIERGAKISAVGTAQEPIVFTSNQPKGQRLAGDWGGIILLGRAPVNKNPAVIEGENITEYGGTDAADNSGTLKYVRIEFAGIAFETDREINALTMGGVGTGTQIDYVQVSYSGDDAYEWFGGTVNAKHLIAYRTLDDDFDTDNGFSGKVQFGYILRDPAIADQAGDSNLFESDNDATGSAATPQTSAIFANVTGVVGPGTLNGRYRSALRLRRNTAVSVYNSLFVGPFRVNGLELEGAATIANFTGGKSDFKGLTFASSSKTITGGDSTAFYNAARGNQRLDNVSTLLLDASYNTLSGAPKLLPQGTSPLLTGAATLPTGFDAAAYRGAFSTTDWTAGWTNFDPNNADY